ncbi:MAG: hypothetical protein JJE50_03710 [Actinomycetales bacterium]|nr:hypothetical protein [Actinomycetales bacterium]
MTSLERRRIGVRITSNLLSGVGVASDVAVGGLLAEERGGTSVAGLAQAASVQRAAVAAVPLAAMDALRGRRWALTVLGLGWSACIVAASSLLATVSSDAVRVPLQGATDAGEASASEARMNRIQVIPGSTRPRRHCASTTPRPPVRAAARWRGGPRRGLGDRRDPRGYCDSDVI